ncbi:hypothetical protein Tco_0636797 [Tanacetum coccineum]
MKGPVDLLWFGVILMVWVEQVALLTDTLKVDTKGNTRHVSSRLTSIGRALPSKWEDMERFLALGWHLEKIHVTWAHLEKKRIRLRTYTKSHEELCNNGWRRCRKHKATPL